MLVTLDKEDFVVSVSREPSDAMVDSAMREIERADMPKLETKLCKGPWHYRGGKGTPLPLDQFPINRYKPGQRTATCADCLNKSGKRNAVAESPEMRKIEEVKTPITPKRNNGGLQFKWKVVHLNPVESVVYAKDYREAGEQVQGPVISVTRLD
jgi:hypothetical protein